MTETQQDKAYNLQQKWIEDNISPEASKSANYGWVVDYVSNEIATKIYRHGVLTTSVPSMTHTFDPF